MCKPEKCLGRYTQRSKRLCRCLCILVPLQLAIAIVRVVLLFTTNKYAMIYEPPIEEAHIKPPYFRFDEPMIAKNYFSDMVREQEMEFITDIWLSDSECDSLAFRRVFFARQHG